MMHRTSTAFLMRNPRKKSSDAVLTARQKISIHDSSLSFRALRLRSGQASSRNGANGTSDMDGYAARVSARESGDERVQSLFRPEISRDVSTSVDMTTDYLHH